ncbi:hypothetical protein GGR54DRAFT_608827 [Hypoxylon sp. NC1633]|nr:hypothetical protein GGR54DRAFT_608827 [Hypoxylon sp. NC1633]
MHGHFKSNCHQFEGSGGGSRFGRHHLTSRPFQFSEHEFIPGRTSLSFIAMFILRQLIARGGPLLLRATTLPASCYDTCNSAFIEAQKIGKQPSLCDPSGTYMVYLENCQTCVTLAGQNDTGIPSEFIDYCVPQTGTITDSKGWSSSTARATAAGSVQGISAVPTSALATESALATSTLATSTYLSINTHYIVNIQTTILPYTATTGGITTTWFFTTVITKLPPIPATTIVEITRTIDETLQTFTFTTTYSQLPISLLDTRLNNLISTSTESAPLVASSLIPANRTETTETTESTETTGTTETTDTTEVTETAETEQYWLPGTVVVSIVVALIIAWVAIFIWRKKTSAPDRHELHGESAEKIEMDAPIRPQELEGPNDRELCLGEREELA